MKRTLLTLAVGIDLLFSVGSITAQVTRQSSASGGDLPQRSVPAPKGLEKKLRGSLAGTSSKLKEVGGIAAPARRAPGQKKDQLPARKNAAATLIQGNCIYRTGAGEMGWYNVKWPADQMVWKRPSQYNPICGFVRDDKIVNFFSLSNGQGIIDAGIAIQDLASGTVSQYYQIDIFDSLEQVAYACAYDEATDIAYLATYNKAGSGMILQKFDPKTMAYTPLGVNIPNDIMDMGWNPADQSLYILSENGELSKFDSKALKFNAVTEYSYDFTGYPNDIVYSPKDKAFFALVDSYDTSGNPCTDAVLLFTNGDLTYLGTIGDNPQYSLLYVADKYVNPDSPKAPTVKSWSVTGAELSGTLTVTLPSKYENGNSLSGNVYLQIETTGATVTGTSFKGAPGSDVDVPVNGQEGLASFIITPYILTDDGKLFGTPLLTTRYFGVDTPAAPQNVKLTADKVTWNAVTNGAHDGYIDSSDVKYDVWVDGQKMNSSPVTGTSLDVAIPNTGQAVHRAEVKAISGGKVSEAGVSGKYYTEGALSLPVDLSPEAGSQDLDPQIVNMFACVKDAMNNNDMRGWRYDDQSERTGGFYSLTPMASSLGTEANEYLFLPPIEFTDASSHYRFAMDVWTGGHYFSETEFYEVVLAREPNGRDCTVIRQKDSIAKKSYFETSETLFEVPEAGTYYIGVRHCSPLGTYRLYARNFKVEQVATTADSPAAISDLSAQAAADGELKATLSFHFPTMSISGNRLDASQPITVTATSEVGEVSTSGLPGTLGSLEVPTKQGDNLIQVVPCSDKGPGPISEIMVYTGVYRPSSPIVKQIVSDDNQTLTLNITIDAYNDEGQYAGPDVCDLTIYRRINGEWRVAEEIGKSRTWTFQCPSPTKQDLYAFGVAAKNAVGYCEEMTTFGVHLGKLYTLPMKEEYTDLGNEIGMNYEPVSLEHLSYLPGEWGFCNPSDADPLASNASGVALYATWECETQAVLPRFSTLGSHNAKFGINLFFGDRSPELVSVLAYSPAIEETLLASFGPKDGKGWETKLVSLPAECQNKGWVQLIIRVQIQGYSQYFLMDGYSVADYPAEMLTITGMTGQAKAAVGDKLRYTVEVENAGTQEMAMPAYTFSLNTPAGARQATAVSVPASIPIGCKGTAVFEYTLLKADKGDVTATFTLSDQPDVAVTTASIQTSVINAPIPVVNDLSANVGGNMVTLSWSKPSHVESFEAFDPWDYSPMLRNFANVDEDGKDVWAITELVHPGKFFPKAYQVYDGSIVQNPLLQAHTGSQYLACMSAKNGPSSDWLISPEVVPGSKVAFWLNLLSKDYPETVCVEYSDASNDPADFIPLEGGTVSPEETGWERYDFTLPSDAAYFAIHHIGNNGQAQFGILIDDLAFSPVEAIAPESYNVYRDGEFIANVATPGYTDNNVDLSLPTMYTVRTVGTLNGETIESDRSNVVWTEESGVEAAVPTGARISGADGAVAFIGFEAGMQYKVADSTGRIVAIGKTAAGTKFVRTGPGVFIATCGNRTAKIIIR